MEISSALHLVRVIASVQESVVLGGQLSVQDPTYIQETEEESVTVVSSLGTIATSQRYVMLYCTVCKQGYGSGSKQACWHIWSACVACNLSNLVHSGALEDEFDLCHRLVKFSLVQCCASISPVLQGQATQNSQLGCLLIENATSVVQR